MLSRRKMDKISPIWEPLFPFEKVPIFSGKKVKHVMELIPALALSKPSTTHDVAEFVLRQSSSDRQHTELRKREIRSLAGIYYKLIVGRSEQLSGGRKKRKKYPGLISDGYVIKTGTKLSEKNRVVPVYFLTLKGCLLAISFNFDNSELEDFISNASKNHLFFAYVDSIRRKTSLNFVKKIFIEPVQKIIHEGKIDLGVSIDFYFPNIARILGMKLRQRIMKGVQTDRIEFDPYFTLIEAKVSNGWPQDDELETLIDNTFHYEKRSIDWRESIIDYFYRSRDGDFYREFSDGPNEEFLLYQVMKDIHYAYWSVTHQIIPRTPRRRLPHSKRWKEYMKYKIKPYHKS